MSLEISDWTNTMSIKIPDQIENILINIHNVGDGEHTYDHQSGIGQSTEMVKSIFDQFPDQNLDRLLVIHVK